MWSLIGFDDNSCRYSVTNLIFFACSGVSGMSIKSSCGNSDVFSDGKNSLSLIPCLPYFDIVHAVILFRYIIKIHYMYPCSCVFGCWSWNKNHIWRTELKKQRLFGCFFFLCLTSSSFALQVRASDAVHTTGSADAHVSPKYLKTTKEKPKQKNPAKPTNSKYACSLKKTTCCRQTDALGI